MTNSQYAPGWPAPAADSLSRQLGLDPSVPLVFDFANSADEPVQVAPGLWRLELPDQPFMVGHSVSCRSDPDSTILTNGVLLPPRTRLPVQVCEGCDPEVLVSPGPEFTFLIADHQPGCA